MSNLFLSSSLGFTRFERFFIDCFLKFFLYFHLRFWEFFFISSEEWNFYHWNLFNLLLLTTIIYSSQLTFYRLDHWNNLVTHLKLYHHVWSCYIYLTRTFIFNLNLLILILPSSFLLIIILYLHFELFNLILH